MKREIYVTPEIEVEVFETQDIITISEDLGLMSADVEAGEGTWNSAWDGMTLR
ncbi:MAG: hypothetical protein Q4C12_08475 [Clostridia bacterium]|nr:hypothetical protein [Clostridia bacterium]